MSAARQFAHRHWTALAFLILAVGFTFVIARQQSNFDEHKHITQEQCDYQWYSYGRRVLLDRALLHIAREEISEHQDEHTAAEVQHLLDTLEPPTCKRS